MFSSLISHIFLADLEGVTQQQAQQYAALSFFYLGKPNKKAQPVFYLIAARLSEAILDTELRSVVAYVSSEIKRVIGNFPFFQFSIFVFSSDFFPLIRREDHVALCDCLGYLVVALWLQVRYVNFDEVPRDCRVLLPCFPIVFCHSVALILSFFFHQVTICESDWRIFTWFIRRRSSRSSRRSSSPSSLVGTRSALDRIYLNYYLTGSLNATLWASL